VSTSVLERTSTALLEMERFLDEPLYEMDDLPGRSVGRSNRVDGRGGLTLDEMVAGVWEGLAAKDAVRCPACGGTMVSRSAARAEAREGVCLNCGARLS
jgi:DNA-directed RNA polymerase subunit RPC12/RpoP